MQKYIHFAKAINFALSHSESTVDLKSHFSWCEPLFHFIAVWVYERGMEDMENPLLPLTLAHHFAFHVLVLQLKHENKNAYLIYVNTLILHYVKAR